MKKITVTTCTSGHLAPPVIQRIYGDLCVEPFCRGTYEDEEYEVTESKALPMIRQGDVLLVKVGVLPPNTKTVKRDNGKLILAYGEATGHTHRVDSPPEEATLFTDADNNRFLQILKDSKLVHEEHTDLHLPAGIYQQVPQQEWQDSMNQREPERGTTRPVFD